MPIQMQLENGSLIGGGGAAFKGANVHLKPLDHGSLGHYRVAIRAQLLAGQAANSRLFELRNSGSNLIVPTRMEITVLPVGSVASPYLLALSLFKCTSFTAVDTTNTATPTVTVLKTSGMSAAPGAASVRYLVGASAGMTGGTLTKDAFPISTLLAWMATITPATPPVTKEMARKNVDEYPLVLAQNEGFIIENFQLGSATANEVQVVCELAWAEVTAY